MAQSEPASSGAPPADSLASSPALEPFSEREFYLAEFRGRTLVLAVPELTADGLGALEPVVEDLVQGGIRLLLVSSERPILERLARGGVLDSSDPGWVGHLWRRLRGAAAVGLQLEPGSLPASCCDVALRLRVAKVVWLDASGGVDAADGDRLSFIDLAGLDAILAERPNPLLREVRRMLDCGLPSVSICRPEELAAELFTYAGSGTFFTRERYTDVRRLALDEFDAAHDLIQRGVLEGYLVARGAAQLDAVLANAFGVFVERRFLAGIGALLPHPDAGAGEIASLYTLTRFLGEGVGGHLVRFALEEARRQGFSYVFACTTSERVEQFFVRHGFALVEPSRIPEAKWRGYDAARRPRVRCLRSDLGP